MTTLRRPVGPDVAQLPLMPGGDVTDGSLLRVVAAVAGAPAQHATEIHIERLIEHEVDHWNRRIELADTLVALGDHETYFAKHIATGYDRAEWGACFSDHQGDVPRWCRELLGTDDEFIRASKHLAQRLYGSMTTRVIARGDFVAAVFRRGNDPNRHVAIMKLDPDSRRVRNFRKVNAQTQVDISMADNILPESKNLAKCALISLRANDPDAWLDIRLLDNQAGPRTQEVAAFFFRGFLTTELVPTARRHTREFVRSSDAWLNDHDGDLKPGELLTFWAARRAALANDRVDIAAFVAEALPTHPELHQHLVAQLQRAMSAPLQTLASTVDQFSVDQSVAHPLVNEAVYEFDAGRISVRPDQLGDAVQIDRDLTPQGKYRITILSQTLKEVSRR